MKTRKRFVAFVTLVVTLAASLASAQPVPPPTGVVTVVPLAVCPGSTQNGTCDDLAWVRARRAAELATPPAQTETAEARRARQAQCVQTYCSGQVGDTVCTCMCRDAYMSVATHACVGLGDATDALVTVVDNHEARLAVLEQRAGVTGARVTVVVRRSHVRRERNRRRH